MEASTQTSNIFIPSKFILLDQAQKQFYQHKPVVNFNNHFNSTSFGDKRYRNIYCVNCGEKGHVVKDCNGPITSFGIIAFKVNQGPFDEKNDKNEKLRDIVHTAKRKQRWTLNKGLNDMYPCIKFLMIQRKDTMGFIDVIRGKYPSDIEAKTRLIKVCLNEMTKTEKDNLMKKSFDELWNDLWVNHESNTFKNEYENAKRKFNQLNIKELIDHSTNYYDFQEFSFPKGRREMRETNITCAEREFCEETGYTKDEYEFLRNYPTVHEDFIGTNGVRYRHIYYVVKMKDAPRPPIFDRSNIIQAGEVQNIGWFTVDECLSIMRPYDIAKKEVVRKVHTDLLHMNYNYDCSTYYYNNGRKSIYKRPYWNTDDGRRYKPGTDY
jgi:8-oxo-dGTP pyrophosphatase MutT (NUDIX family)